MVQRDARPRQFAGANLALHVDRLSSLPGVRTLPEHNPTITLLEASRRGG